MSASNQPSPPSLLQLAARESVLVEDEEREFLEGASEYYAPHGSFRHHGHRVAAARYDELLEAAFADPRTTDAHVDTVRERIDLALGDVADGDSTADAAWEEAITEIAGSIRAYDVEVDISGLHLTTGGVEVGPVSLMPSSDEQQGDEHLKPHDPFGPRGKTTSVATVRVSGCPLTAEIRATALIEAACDVLRAFAHFINPLPDPMPVHAINVSWMYPWFAIQVGERFVKRSGTTYNAVRISDPDGFLLPLSELWAFDGSSGASVSIDSASVRWPDAWPAPKTIERFSFDEASRLLSDWQVPWPDGATRFWMAIRWLARSASSDSPTDALVFAVISTEALVGPTARVDGRYRMIAERTAALVERDRRARAASAKTLSGYYDARHDLLHAKGGGNAAWADAIDARRLAFRAICRFAEQGFTKREDAVIERWFNGEATAGR